MLRATSSSSPDAPRRPGSGGASGEMGMGPDTKRGGPARRWPHPRSTHERKEQTTKGAFTMHVQARPARGPTSTEPRPTIVVGYDGSNESRAALTVAAARAGEGGTVVAVFAAEP